MHIDIMVGSVLGASEYVAEALEVMLQGHGHSTHLYFKPNIDDLKPGHLLLIVTSTHGAGDLPENIQAFAKHLADKDLSNTQAIIVGLGDSSYDTFCEGSRIIETIIKQAGGKVLLPIFQIDVLHHPIPEDIAVEWLQQNIDILN